jgi:hypothetical protein
LPEVLLRYRWADSNISVLHSEQQRNITRDIKQNILNKLTDDTEKQVFVQDCAQNKIKCGILIPKWLGKICCLFIFNRQARHQFRYKYIKR